MTSGINTKNPFLYYVNAALKNTHLNRWVFRKGNKNTIRSGSVRLFKIKFKRKTLDYCYCLSYEG